MQITHNENNERRVTTMAAPAVESTTTGYIDVIHLEEGDHGLHRNDDGEISQQQDQQQQLLQQQHQEDHQQPNWSAEYIRGSLMDVVDFDGIEESLLRDLKIASTSPVGIMAVVTMVLSMSILGFGSGAVVLYIWIVLSGFIISPAVVIQKMKLQQEPTFREVSNELRMKVNDFAMSNSVLQSESDRLERQVMRLSAVEERFNEIVGREQVDVARARSLVRANGQIQTEMKKLQAAAEMQSIMEAIMLADKDGNYHISEKELNELSLRLKVIAGSRSSLNNHSPMTEDAIKTAFSSAMTHHGASVGRIHSHLQHQRQDDTVDDDNNADTGAESRKQL